MGCWPPRLTGPPARRDFYLFIPSPGLFIFSSQAYVQDSVPVHRLLQMPPAVPAQASADRRKTGFITAIGMLAEVRFESVATERTAACSGQARPRVNEPAS